MPEADFVPQTKVLPDGRAVVEMGLSQTARQKNIAATVRTYDGVSKGYYKEGDYGVLPGGFADFIHGLSMVGDFDLIQPKMVQQVKPDGSTVTVMDPVDAILTGRASPTTSLDYLFSRIDRAGINTGLLDKTHPARRLVELWDKEYKEYLMGLAKERRDHRDQQYERSKDQAYDDGDIADFNKNTGANYAEYMATRYPNDASLLEEVKMRLRNLDQKKPLELSK